MRAMLEARGLSRRPELQLIEVHIWVLFYGEEIRRDQKEIKKRSRDAAST
jgi:hypothetical protein